MPRQDWWVILPILWIIFSCASVAPLKPIWGEKPAEDKFSRIYPIEFANFHSEVNITLQDFAEKNKGNSFQILRLGSEAVVLQGRYKREQDPKPFPLSITIKPSGPGKTWMGIKFSPADREASPEYLEIAAAELFGLIEKETGFRPQKK